MFRSTLSNHCYIKTNHFIDPSKNYKAITIIPSITVTNHHPSIEQVCQGIGCTITSWHELNYSSPIASCSFRKMNLHYSHAIMLLFTAEHRFAN